MTMRLFDATPFADYETYMHYNQISKEPERAEQSQDSEEEQPKSKERGTTESCPVMPGQ